MNFFSKKAAQFLESFEKMFSNNIDILSWFLGFSGIVAVRELVKSFLATMGLSLQEIVIDYIHEFLFFAITFFLIWSFLVYLLKIEYAKLSKIFFWSSWIIIFPPIIDMLKTEGEIYWSFYLLGNFQELWLEFRSIFGNLPSGIVYFGTRIMIMLAVFLAGIIAYVQSRKITKTVLAIFGAYCIFFFMAAFPAFFVFIFNFISGKSIYIGAVEQIQFFGNIPKIFGLPFESMKYSLAYNLNLIFYLIFFFLLAFLFFYADKKKFLAILKNSRFPQVFYHFGLFFIGMGLGFLAYPEKLSINIFSICAVTVLLISIYLAWKASVIVNDIFDFGIDKITNFERPLPSEIYNENEYKKIGYIIFAFSLLGGLVVGFKFMAILAIYQFLAWTYSANPFRIKRFFILATLLSAITTILILFMGFALFSGDHNIQGLPWKIILLFLIVFTISLPIKDFKDIEGDKKCSIWTLPVILGEKKGRIIVAINVFISHILSVFFLNELRLFWWAILFGTLNYLVITSEKIKPRQLFWPVLGLVFVYGLILVKIVFL